MAQILVRHSVRDAVPGGQDCRCSRTAASDASSNPRRIQATHESSHALTCRHLTCCAILLVGIELQAADWTIDGADDWTRNIKSAEGAIVLDGSVSPKEKTAMVVTRLDASDAQRSAKSLTVTQSPIWQNWNPIENLGPVNLGDAPVLLTVGPDNYWMFGRYGSGQPTASARARSRATRAGLQAGSRNARRVRHPTADHPIPESVQRAGWAEAGKGGYHAWQSRDMKNWVHHGPVTEGFSQLGHQRGMGRWQGADLLRLPERSGSARLCR